MVSGGTSRHDGGHGRPGPRLDDDVEDDRRAREPAASVAVHVTVVTPRGKVDHSRRVCTPLPGSGMRRVVGAQEALRYDGTPAATAAPRSRHREARGRRSRVPHSDRESARPESCSRQRRWPSRRRWSSRAGRSTWMWVGAVPAAASGRGCRLRRGRPRLRREPWPPRRRRRGVTERSRPSSTRTSPAGFRRRTRRAPAPGMCGGLPPARCRRPVTYTVPNRPRPSRAGR